MAVQLTEKQQAEGWRVVKFGEMANQISKRVEPSETDLDVYVGLEHLDSGSLRIKRHGHPSDVKGQKLLVRAGQIIFGKRRAYQRKVGVAEFDGICSAHAMVLEARPEMVLPEFLPFFIQSDLFMDRAVAISEGSLSPTIKWKALASQEFPLPPIEQQRDFTKLLGSHYDCTIKYEDFANSSTFFYSVSVNTLLSRGQGNFKLKKTKIGLIPSHWKVVQLSEVVSFQPGYAFKSKDFVDEGVRLLRGANVGVEKAIWKETKYLPSDQLKLFKDYSLNVDDIIIAMDRPFISEGFKVTKVSESDIPSLLVQRVGRFTNTKSIYNQYLWHLTHSKFVMGHLKAQQKGMDLPHISKDEILSCLVPLPPENEQKELIRLLDASEMVIAGNYDKYQKLLTLRSSLLNNFYC